MGWVPNEPFNVQFDFLIIVAVCATLATYYINSFFDIDNLITHVYDYDYNYINIDRCSSSPIE